MRTLLQREREMDVLEEALREAAGGRGVAVGIEADAGLGKTRLLHEVRAMGTAAGFDVLTARATELEREFPFALARQLFDAPLAALSLEEREEIFAGADAARAALQPDQGGDFDTFAVLHGLYWVAAALAQRAPLLLAVDDLHWADPGSLEFLGFLLPRLEELPVLMVMAARSDEPEAADGLGRVLADGSVRHLSPAPLRQPASAELVAHELDRVPDAAFSAACHEATGGNPFLLVELARTLAERAVEPTADQVEFLRELAPEGVARLVLIRLARLPAGAVPVAQWLAILGDEERDHRLVAELADLDLEALHRSADALRASAILDGGGHLRFSHPLVRNAIYADMPAGQRTEAHSRAAAALRERGADAERIATQLLAGEARGDRATVETLIEAGERALAAGAPRSAMTYLTRALREPPPQDLHVEVLDRLIAASFQAGDASALPAIEADVARAMEDDPSLRSRWAVPLTMVMAVQGRFEDAASMLKGAVEVAVAEGDVERAFQLEAHLATLALLVPSVPKVSLEHYLDQIDPDSPAGRLAAAMEIRSAMVNGTGAEAADAAKRALAHDGIIFSEEPELAAALVAVITLVVTDEIEAGRRAAELALATAREVNGAPQLARGWSLRGFAAWGGGDLIEAEADMRQAIDLARLAGIVPIVMMNTPPLVEILIERDELDAAEAELKGIGMDAGPVPPNFPSIQLLVIRVHLRWEQRRVEEAAADFAALAAIADDLGLGDAPILSAAPWAVPAMIAIGERDRAQEWAEAALVGARRFGVPSSISHAQRTFAAARGGKEAVEALREAVAILEDSPRRLQRLHALVDLGAALRAEGRRVEAREPLREAIQLARRCGAVRAAKRAREELQATGETVRRFAPIGVESLTPSERRVAELAASGMTNRQIAQSLFVTVKTVEAHLSATYDKLDIDSRRELGAALGGPEGL